MSKVSKELSIGYIGYGNMAMKRLKAIFSLKSYKTKTSYIVDKKIKAIGKVSFKKNLENNCIIYGKNGIIKIPSPWLPGEKSFIEVIKKNHYYKNFVNLTKDIYFLQAEKISNIFLEKDSDQELLVDINESVKLMSIIDSWIKS